MKLFKSNNLRAFTLVEAMVATVIIIIAISGPLAVAVASSGYVRDTKDNMTSIYLAQEGIDLLRYKRDSLVIECLNNYNSATCPTIDFETEPEYISLAITGSSSPKESAWKIFKTQMGDDLVAGHCFSNGGCTYDSEDFLGHQLETVNVRLFGGTCDYLYRKDSGIGDKNDDFVYLCDNQGGYTKTNFSRKVKLERTSTSTNVYLDNYHDDLKATVSVTYVRHNGLIKEVKLIDFLHGK